MSHNTGGDDLEDGFDIDSENFSPGEDVSQVVQELAKEKKRKRKKKRKAEVSTLTSEAEHIQPQAKRRKTGKVEEDMSETLTVALQPSTVQAEYFYSLLGKVHKNSTSLELDDLRLSDAAFVDSHEYGSSRDIEHLPQFIAQVLPVLKTRLTQRSANKGAPTLLLITSSALRATEFTRILRGMRGPKSGEIAKLFARHFKLEEHAQYLQNHHVCAGVGTAGRIGKLLGHASALSLNALTHILIDSHIDVKKRSIFDIPETRDALIKDIFENTELKQSIVSGKVSIVLF
ncbi:hypothetical protein FRC20_012030 [Serendipita sp. 405]|nr:hypothetical protein FRC15_000768 [Serendipita sp. 397]KAG8870302.1 hypothetical protein FRC20_012030 [Serendipita sp. 405]